MAGRLIVVCGLPGSGKTTLATRLERDHDAVRFSADDWMAELGIDIWDIAARARLEALRGRIARRLLAAGLTVIVEWGSWSRVERDGLRAMARSVGATVELRFLDAPLDELHHRVVARDRERHVGHRSITREEIDEWSTWIERPDAAELAMFDPPAGSTR